MKQTETNEMDLLLHGLARSEGARPVAPEDHSAIHLDADELNSYAERALPAAARARYTSHLAECASCRKIVSELTSASGGIVSEHSVSQKSSTGLLQKIGTLFSPGFLRYGVPAVALLAFIAVGLIALRQQPQPEFVAQNQPMASRDATLEPKQAGSPGEPEDSAAAIDERRSSESRSRAGKENNQAKAGERNETSNVATPRESVSVTSDKNTAPGKAAVVVDQPLYAPEPAAPPPPKPQTTQAEARTEVAARQKEEADKKDEPAREQEGARARTDDSQNQVAVAKAKRAGRPASQSDESVRRPGATLASGAGAKTNDDEANIRTVSGRRFRRQEGVWIDTAYQSSTATTTLTRGSEQFRAFVADEPGIRAIAAQLPGEVVVVWKGRAYRIR